MGQYKTIFLIASAAMRRTPAFEYASHLAKATGAKLHICVFDHSEVIAAVGFVNKPAAGPAREAYIDVRRDWAVTEAHALREQGIDATGDAAWARPMAQEILLQVAEIKPDIVIKDAVHEPLIERVLFTPLDWQLLRLCPAPLLLVNSAASALPSRVVAAIDAMRAEPADADFTKKIIHAALALSIQCDAELHLATAFNPFSDLSMNAAVGGAIMTAEIYNALRDSQQAAFSAVADEQSVPADRRHIVQGPPAIGIAELVKSNQADVVVVGTTHRKGWERLLMGSSAEGIFEYAACNVLAVKPDGFEKYFDEYMQALH